MDPLMNHTAPGPPQATNTASLLTPVTVFWDIENCGVPRNVRGTTVVSAIRKLSLRHGLLRNISAVGNLKSIKEELRIELQGSAVLMHDVPSGKPSAADIAILVELLKLVCDSKPPHKIILISGDRDFSNVLNVLVFRGYEVILIHLPQVSDILKSAATQSIEWNAFLQLGEREPDGSTPQTGRSSASPANAQVGTPSSSRTAAPSISLATPGAHSSPSRLNPAPTGASDPASGTLSSSPPSKQEFAALLGIIRSLAHAGKSRILLSELGAHASGQMWKEMGYKKLRDFVMDARSQGVVEYGGVSPSEWVSLMPGFGGVSSRPATASNAALYGSGGIPVIPNPLATSSGVITSTISSSRSFESLPSQDPLNGAEEAPVLDAEARGLVLQALQDLKRDQFKPTEEALWNRLKHLFRMKRQSLTRLFYEELLDVMVTEKHVKCQGLRPYRTIIGPKGPFDGADPDNPTAEFPASDWIALQNFLLQVHPVQKKGRFGFAQFLKEKGPPQLKAYPLGLLTEMVQIAQGPEHRLIVCHTGLLHSTGTSNTYSYSSTTPVPFFNPNSTPFIPTTGVPPPVSSPPLPGQPINTLSINPHIMSPKPIYPHQGMPISIDNRTSPIHMNHLIPAPQTPTSPPTVDPIAQMSNTGHPNIPDVTVLLGSLHATLSSLASDQLKPLETIIKARLRLELSQAGMEVAMKDKVWSPLLEAAGAHGFIIQGEKPNRVIYPPSGEFPGVDPNHPDTSFPPAIWDALDAFLRSIHPYSNSSRYAFAINILNNGPTILRELSLGHLTVLVQLALDKNILLFNKPLICTRDPPPEPEKKEPPPAPPTTPSSPTASISFSWRHGGSRVLLTGSWCGWVEHRELSPSPDGSGKMSLTMQLRPGVYQYKYIVDGEWRVDPTQPTVRDSSGTENNLLAVDRIDRPS
eukprot:TRINITY_DN2669_c0_g1_i2.p1 TRINITY_DN2669_c0_g1~~TRINITY_DN2669_c0_g1_i2.p1  ORF type:complete len:922 (+),score=223.04 TRINITY_DN2669_c0_g1_i2:122-2887(+)